MRVTIDGTEYVAVTAKQVTVDGVVYAELDTSRWPGARPAKIIDNDDDEWVPDSLLGDTFRCKRSVNIAHRTRDEIRKYYGIVREEF